MVEWQTTFQIECLDPITGEAVNDINMGLGVDQQMSVIIDCKTRTKFFKSTFTVLPITELNYR